MKFRLWAKLLNFYAFFRLNMINSNTKHL